MLIAPLFPPKQSTLVELLIVTVGPPALVTEALPDALHPLASVTLTELAPDAWSPISSVVAPLLHAYVNGDVPPVTVKFTDPLLLPQVELVATALAVGPAALFTVALAVALHEFISVTVTEYVPAVNPLISSVVAPLLH